MTFTDALRENRLPATLGDIKFQYQPSLLVGEARGSRVPDFLTSVLLVGGLSSALLAAVSLLLSPANVHVGFAAAFGVLCALLLGFSTRRETLFRFKRRFILNFATECLRIDRPRSFLGRPYTQVVHFDGIRSLDVLSRDDRSFSLIVTFLPEPDAESTQSELLVDRVLPERSEDLRKTWRFLQAAFALQPTPIPPEPAGA